MANSHARLSISALLLLLTGLISGLAISMLLLNPGATLIFGPLAALFVISAILSGLGAVWFGSPSLHVFLVAAAIVTVDLGFALAGPAPLAIKSASYAAVTIAGLHHLFTGRRLGFTLCSAFLCYALFAWATVLRGSELSAIAHTGFALTALALAGVVIERLEFEQAAKIAGWVAVLIGIGSAISIAIYVVWPQHAISLNTAGTGRTGGIFGSPNSFGAVTAIGLMTSLAALRSPQMRVGPRYVLVIVTLASLAGLLLSGSRTAIGALVLALGLVALSIRIRLVMMMTIATATVAFGLWLSGGLEGLLQIAESALSRSPRTGDVRTLTGRLDIWHFAYTQWLTEPWLGFGLGESRKVISEGWANRWGGTTGSAHNMLFESLLNVGLIGTLVLFGIVLVAVIRIFKVDPIGNTNAMIARPLAVGLLAFPLIQGITEKSFGGTASMSTGALVLALGYATVLGRGSR